MHKSEMLGGRTAQMSISLFLGGLLALGADLLMLLVVSAAISRGMIKPDAAAQAAVAACTVGCMLGTAFVCGTWKGNRLLAGIGTGVVSFLLILGIGMMMGDGPVLGSQALAELAGCLGGGAVVGLFGRKKKKKSKKPAHMRKG